MDRFANAIINHKKTVIILFIAIALICVFLQLFVDINYNLADYLPPDAQSTKAIQIMDEEFSESIPNANVMMRDTSIMQALEYKQMLASVKGVTQVIWLDDVMDIKQPMDMGNPDTIEGFYKNGNALFSVSIAEGMEKQACDRILDLIGEDDALSGEAVDLVGLQEATGAEVMNAFSFILPAFIIILVLSTASWIEPLLFLAAIGISIIINMGTNIFLGEISFMTNSVSPILQLACTLDYAVFLLHSFADNRKKYADVHDAMQRSVKESMPTIAGSAATTMFGFLALVFMDFGIGADLGLNLAKGIALSFISVIVFLPALTLNVYKLIDKTKHRKLMPSFKNVNKILSKIAIPAVVIVVLLIVPSFLGQRQAAFTYGNDVSGSDSRNARDSAAIEQVFGESTVMALLVPKGSVAKEQDLCRDIEDLDHVTGVASYTTQVGAAIPPEFLDEDITQQFYSENYARIIVYTDTPQEGDTAFKTVKRINEKVESYYGSAFYSAGQSANLYDMKNVVKKDNYMVNMIAIFAIFCVLIMIFKSAVLPFILLLTIETAIWVNLSIPYFIGEPIFFLGYLILCTVQLGSTVDYAILLTNRYLTNRKRMLPREAIHITLGETFKSIIISGFTLATAGFTLYATSSNMIISGLGLLLGRGTLLSILMVVCFLPSMLLIFDKAIKTTTYRSGFYNPKRIDYLEGQHEDQNV
jgi:predicted RND superfamily exporter protein